MRVTAQYADGSMSDWEDDREYQEELEYILYKCGDVDKAWFGDDQDTSRIPDYDYNEIDLLPYEICTCDSMQEMMRTGVFAANLGGQPMMMAPIRVPIRYCPFCGEQIQINDRRMKR